MPATYLDSILAAHRAAAARPRPGPGTRAADGPRGFRAALAASAGLAVIAEIKRHSPSKGDLHRDLDAALMAKSYADGGAACLSVLTDVEFFKGSPEDLVTARAAVELPVLRKDFTVCEADVDDAFAMGADAVLLIVAALDDAELRDFHARAVGLGLDVLVEIHDEPELDRALGAGATMVGVNQRDLVTFQVDHARAERMASLIPDTVVKVAESGVRDGADAARLRAAGYQAVLVGESVVTSTDPTEAVKELRRCS